MLTFLKATKQDTLKLEANKYVTVAWLLDATLRVDHDYKSHIGLGSSSMYVVKSESKKFNKDRTSLSMDDNIAKAVWTKLSKQEHICRIIENTIDRDIWKYNWQRQWKYDQNWSFGGNKFRKDYEIEHFQYTEQ